MEKVLNKELQKQVKKLLDPMKNKITIALFTTTDECESCEPTQQIITEVAELSDKVEVKIYDLKTDTDEVSRYNIEMAPSFVILDQEGQYKGVKFNGIPAGHEFNSFLSALVEMSGVESEVPQEFMDRVAKIDKPINIKVFVTMSCPHCPGAVQKAHKLAMMNKNIVGEMIEAQTFYELSEKYNVSGVPKIVINDTVELIGNQPIEKFLSSIESL
jgi:glutaredoxin-like protein